MLYSCRLTGEVAEQTQALFLDTLERLGLDESERFWVTSKAIAGELLALAALFVVLQAGDPVMMTINTGVLVAMLVGLPLLFVAMGRWVVPHAPGSEFSLLPVQNATGNWVKVVQRIPVRIRLDNPPAELALNTGLSATAEVDTGHARELPQALRSVLAALDLTSSPASAAPAAPIH